MLLDSQDYLYYREIICSEILFRSVKNMLRDSMRNIHYNDKYKQALKQAVVNCYNDLLSGKMSDKLMQQVREKHNNNVVDQLKLYSYKGHIFLIFKRLQVSL